MSVMSDILDFARHKHRYGYLFSLEELEDKIFTKIEELIPHYRTTEGSAEFNKAIKIMKDNVAKLRENNE